MLCMGPKKTVTRELRIRYQKGGKKKKIMISLEFNKVAGYNRSYDSQVLGKSKILCYVQITGGKINILNC